MTLVSNCMSFKRLGNGINMFQLMVNGVSMEAGLIVLHRAEEELEHGSEPAIILLLLTAE